MDDDSIVSAKYSSRGKLGCDITFDYHYNVATNISIKKKRTLVEALIAINKFKLPNELIDIIKDYIFRDKTAMLQRSIFQPGVLHSYEILNIITFLRLLIVVIKTGQLCTKSCITISLITFTLRNSFAKLVGKSINIMGVSIVTQKNTNYK